MYIPFSHNQAAKPRVADFGNLYRGKGSSQQISRTKKLIPNSVPKTPLYEALNTFNPTSIRKRLRATYRILLTVFTDSKHASARYIEHP